MSRSEHRIDVEVTWNCVLADHDEATATGGHSASGRSKPSVPGLDHHVGTPPELLRRLDGAMKPRLDAAWHRAVATGG
jgi:hypothetical protein